MKSMWRVIERPVAGRIFYQAYRLLDVCADNTEQNRETEGGYYDTRKDAEDLKAEYRARHDTMYAFLYSGLFVEVTGDRQDYIRKTVFEDLYEVYCDRNDITNPLKRKNIRPRLASMGIVVKNHSNVEVYTGIRKIGSDLGKC